jgi:hypothetical protein
MVPSMRSTKLVSHSQNNPRRNDRMPASGGIWNQAKLSVEMIDVFLVCLFARVMKTEASYSLGPLTWVFRLELPLW